MSPGIYNDHPYVLRRQTKMSPGIVKLWQTVLVWAQKQLHLWPASPCTFTISNGSTNPGD
eukprot:1144657-Pelagomonas_calceolata.AAC.7